MSGDALLAIWNAAPIDWDALEPFRLAIKSDRRPSKHAIAIVDQVLALCVIPSRGYADPTYEQILARCPSIKSIDTVKHALRVLKDSGRWVTIKGPCRGQHGMPGRAPQRVFFKHDPMNHLKKVDCPKNLVYAESLNLKIDEISQETKLACSVPNQQRIQEIESNIAEWEKCAEDGPPLVISLAKRRIIALQRDLTKELTR